MSWPRADASAAAFQGSCSFLIGTGPHHSLGIATRLYRFKSTLFLSSVPPPPPSIILLLHLLALQPCDLPYYATSQQPKVTAIGSQS